MAFRRGNVSKRKRTRKVGSKKNITKKRRFRGGISLSLQNKIKDYNVNCQVKNWYTGKFVDKRNAPACDLRKKTLEELYKQERPDRAQIAADYGVENPAEINDVVTKPKKRWGFW
jgi:hypothetical protein